MTVESHGPEIMRNAKDEDLRIGWKLKCWCMTKGHCMTEGEVNQGVVGHKA